MNLGGRSGLWYIVKPSPWTCSGTVGQISLKLLPHSRPSPNQSALSIPIIICVSWFYSYLVIPSNVRSFESIGPSAVSPAPKLRASVCSRSLNNDITITRLGEEDDTHGGLHNYR